MNKPYFLSTRCPFRFSFVRKEKGTKNDVLRMYGTILLYNNSSVPDKIGNTQIDLSDVYAFRANSSASITHTIIVDQVPSRGRNRAVLYDYTGFGTNFRDTGSYNPTYIIQSANNWSYQSEFFPICGNNIRIQCYGPNGVNRIRLKFYDLFPDKDITITFENNVMNNEDDVRGFLGTLPDSNGYSRKIILANSGILHKELYYEIAGSKGWSVEDISQ